MGATADIMYALSYIASCQYIKSFGLLTAVNSDGACFDLGDGLIYLMCAQGLIGAGFFLVTCVGVMGSRRFDSKHHAGGITRDVDDPEDKFTSVGLDDQALARYTGRTTHLDNPVLLPK